MFAKIYFACFPSKMLFKIVLNKNNIKKRKSQLVVKGI